MCSEKGEEPLKFQIDLRESYETHAGMDRKTGDLISSSTFEDEDFHGSKQLLTQIKKKAEEEKGDISSDHISRQRKGVHYYDGGIDMIVSNFTTISFAISSSFIAFIKIIKPLLIQWLENSGNRSITVKSGDIEIRVTGSKDIDEVVEAVQKLQKKRSSDTSN